MQKWYVARFTNWVGASKYGLLITVKSRYSKRGFARLDGFPKAVTEFLESRKLKWLWYCEAFHSLQELRTELVHGRIVRDTASHVDVLFSVDVTPAVEPPEQLACMASHYDGAHWGLTDWYSEIEAGIVAALKRGRRYSWTTGWYSSKKEIASACITHQAGQITVEVSVSDDFDTPGLGVVRIPHARALKKLVSAVDRAWDLAEADRKCNAAYVGFSIIKDGSWVETYIKKGWPAYEYAMKRPPGDNYHRWGWQRDGEVISKSLRRQMAAWIEERGTEKQFGEYIVRPWESEE